MKNTLLSLLAIPIIGSCSLIKDIQNNSPRKIIPPKPDTVYVSIPQKN